jgi:hypothetical protein
METGLAPLQLDDIDPSSASVRRYLREKGLVKPNEFLIAVQLFVGETHHNNQLAKPYIRAFLLEGADNYEDVKKRFEELESAGEPFQFGRSTLICFLRHTLVCLNRFAVMLTWQDLPLMDREYTVTEED